jgi:hypothetical protein
MHGTPTRSQPGTRVSAKHAPRSTSRLRSGKGGAMTLPGTDTDTVIDEEAAAELRRKHEASIEDNFRHIVCFLCYPAFATARVAPHDAECICGKPVLAGDVAGPSTAPECILCNETAEAHYRAAHA